MARRRTPIFAAVSDEMVSSGLQPDRHTLKRILWESAANVTFWNGTVRRKLPPALAFNSGQSAPIRGIAQTYMTDGSRWTWAGANTHIVRWSFGAPVEVLTIDPYVADQTATQRPTFYDFTPYGNWMIVNTGQPAYPAVIFKNPATGTFALDEAPIGVLRYMKVLSFLMAIGYGARGTQVGWSDANNIEEWTASSTNTAGSISIDEFNTPIRAGAKLGDAVAVYSEDQVALVRYVGSPYIFGQKTTIDGIGAIGKMAVATDGRINVGFGRAGAWWTDGNSSRYIDEGYIANYFQDNITWSQASKIVVGRNDYTGCFEFHFPTRGAVEPNESWSWDPRTGGWSPIPTFPMFDERRLFDHVLYGTSDGKVMLGDYDETAAGALSLETKPLVMSTVESPHIAVRVDEVDLLLHQATGIEWRIGCAEEPNGDWVWSPWMEATAGAKIYQAPAGDDDGQPLPETPFWKIAFRSTTTIWRFDLQGFLLYGEQVGTKA